MSSVKFQDPKLICKIQLYFYTLATNNLKVIPFMIASKRLKYQHINFTKHVQDLYSEIYKTLLKEIEKTYVNGRALHVNRIETLDIVRMPIISKV